MLTTNVETMLAEIQSHIDNDQLMRGTYWDGGKGCFIGCLTHSDDPRKAEDRFGIPVPLMRIAESIFEALPDDKGREFFADFGRAVAVDGKDLSRVHWAFLAEELRALPAVPEDIQAVIDPVIAGMDLLASGNDWPAAYAAYAASRAAYAAYAAYAASRAAYAAYAAYAASRAADAAAYAADAAAYAADAAAYAADARDRQAATFIRLIADAPVAEADAALELLPCPFCGGDNVEVFGPVGWHRQFGITHSCRAFHGGSGDFTIGGHSKMDAIRAWNTRAALSPADSKEG